MKKKRRAATRKQWQDHYTRRAQKEKYPARSVYKLQEMQQKYQIIRHSDRVLDLGCAPGSWLLFAAKQTGPTGKVVGIDLKKINVHLPSHTQTIQGDITDTDSNWLKQTGGDFNLVISDMAPATTGNKAVDAARSFELCRAALEVALMALKPNGNFVCKIFQGPDFKSFEHEVRNSFKKIKIFKPQSSRKASKELFIIGFGKKTPG